MPRLASAAHESVIEAFRLHFLTSDNLALIPAGYLPSVNPKTSVHPESGCALFPFGHTGAASDLMVYFDGEDTCGDKRVRIQFSLDAVNRLRVDTERAQLVLQVREDPQFFVGNRKYQSTLADVVQVTGSSRGAPFPYQLCEPLFKCSDFLWVFTFPGMNSIYQMLHVICRLQQHSHLLCNIMKQGIPDLQEYLRPEADAMLTSLAD
eukprot:gene2927-biopygen3115